MLRCLSVFLLVVGLAPGVPVRGQSPAPSYSRTPSGIEYQLFRKDAQGRYQPRALAPAGDAPFASRQGKFLTLFLEYRTGRDSVLMSSRRLQPKPQPFPLAPAAPGGLEEALGLLLPGDSGVFRLSADSVFAKSFRQPVPPFIRRGGNTLVVLASAQELLTEAEVMARQQQAQAEQQKQAAALAAKQLVKDDALIQAYLKKNKLTTAKKTAGGTYYLITRPGKGLPPKKNQTVSVLYKGTVMATGKEFDSSAKHGNVPISFPLGIGQVISGWDQGIAMLTKGSKAILLIPSPQAYGPRGAGADIPANAVLRFDVELVDIK
jgi:FKBP-type peptidyl-prolyl cis-trans isomerase